MSIRCPRRRRARAARVTRNSTGRWQVAGGNHGLRHLLADDWMPSDAAAVSALPRQLEGVVHDGLSREPCEIDEVGAEHFVHPQGVMQQEAQQRSVPYCCGPVARSTAASSALACSRVKPSVGEWWESTRGDGPSGLGSRDPPRGPRARRGSPRTTTAPRAAGSPSTPPSPRRACRPSRDRPGREERPAGRAHGSRTRDATRRGLRRTHAASSRTESPQASPQPAVAAAGPRAQVPATLRHPRGDRRVSTRMTTDRRSALGVRAARPWTRTAY